MPPRPRFEKLDSERREAILDAATREFAREGAEHASLNKILSEVGVSKGAAYYYFDDKEDLFLTVLARGVDRAAHAIGGIGEVHTEAEFWEGFRALYARVLGFLRDHPTLAALAKRFLSSSPTLVATPQIGARYAAFRGWFRSLLEQGQKVGAVRTDLPMDMLVAVTFGLGEAFDRWTIAHWEQVGKSDESLDAIIDAGIDLFRRALEPARKVERPKEKKR